MSNLNDNYMFFLYDSNCGIYLKTYLPTSFLQLFKSGSSWSLVRWFQTSINFPYNNSINNTSLFNVHYAYALLYRKVTTLNLANRKCFLPHKLIKTATINCYLWLLYSVHNLLTCVTMSATYAFTRTNLEEHLI